jgi:hypothetical protein
MELIHQLCERDIFKLGTTINNQIKCLKNTAFKQKTFQIVKEHTTREASRDHTNSCSH